MQHTGLVMLVTALACGGLLAQARPVRNYVIGPKDVVSLICLEDPALTGKFTVETDGTFTLPYLGVVKAASLTLRELEEALSKKLIEGRFFRNPQITASIEQYRSQYVVLMGEVGRPGIYPLTGGMTLLDLIAQAGTLTPSASGTVLIVPSRAAKVAAPDTSTPNGKGDHNSPITQGEIDAAQDAGADSGIVRADLSELQRGVLDRPIALLDGDIVIAQRAERAYVLGEVKAPGPYAVAPNMTLQQLLALAGGQSADAALNRVRIARFENGVRVELKNVKLTELVRPGDTVIVPTRFW